MCVSALGLTESLCDEIVGQCPPYQTSMHV